VRRSKLVKFDKVTKFFSENDIDILINLSQLQLRLIYLHKIDIEIQITDLVGINIYGTLNLLAEALQKNEGKKNMVE
jgi:hypothetical protein